MTFHPLLSAWRGAKWLDAEVPGWMDRITRKVLTGSGRDCVMGQVFEHDPRLPPEAERQYRSVWSVMTAMVPGPWSSMEWQQDHGFNTTYEVPYEDVDAAWRRVFSYRNQRATEG